jgi:hypothetical protein
VESINYTDLIINILKMSVIPVIGLALIAFLFMYLHDRFRRRTSETSASREEMLRLEVQALAARKIANRNKSGNLEVKMDFMPEVCGKSDDGFIEGEPL